jgi:hypothetical protein
MIFSYGIGATCDDVVFIASYNNETIDDEVQWLAKRNKIFLPNICLSSKVGSGDMFINGTIIKI